VDGLLFFFFQAEDGIRDPLVTGVQTCALPIFVEGCTLDQIVHVAGVSSTPRLRTADRPWPAAWGRNRRRCSPTTRPSVASNSARSEERRVGKEFRWRWVQYAWDKKRASMMYTS